MLVIVNKKVEFKANPIVISSKHNPEPACYCDNGEVWVRYPHVDEKLQQALIKDKTNQPAPI